MISIQNPEACEAINELLFKLNAFAIDASRGLLIMSPAQFESDRQEARNAERERYAKVVAAAKLYKQWADKTGDYPHDEDGCEAHAAIVSSVNDIL